MLLQARVPHFTLTSAKINPYTCNNFLSIFERHKQEIWFSPNSLYFLNKWSIKLSEMHAMSRYTFSLVARYSLLITVKPWSHWNIFCYRLYSITSVRWTMIFASHCTNVAESVVAPPLLRLILTRRYLWSESSQRVNQCRGFYSRASAVADHAALVKISRSKTSFRDRK